MATSDRPLVRPKRLIGLLLLYWLAVLILSVGVIELPDLLLPLFLAIGLPICWVSGTQLWRYATHTASGLAYRDDLTGLSNRRAFRQYAESRVAPAASGTQSIIFVDVDSLKAVNDECGHQAGDELLTRVAERLSKVAPDPSSVFRLGGDEFAILVDRSSGHAVAELVGKLGPFRSTFESCEHEHAVTISYGVTSNIHGETFEQFFSRADKNLREHKYRLHGATDRQERPASPALASAHARIGANISSLDERRRSHSRDTGS